MSEDRYEVVSQGFTHRTCNCLLNDLLEDMRDIATRPDDVLLRIPGLGHKSLAEIRKRQAELGLPASPKKIVAA